MTSRDNVQIALNKNATKNSHSATYIRELIKPISEMALIPFILSEPRQNFLFSPVATLRIKKKSIKTKSNQGANAIIKLKPAIRKPISGKTPKEPITKANNAINPPYYN